MKRRVKQGKDRKPHVFRKKNERGKNATRPIELDKDFVLAELEAMLDALWKDDPGTGAHKIYFKMQLSKRKDYSWDAFVRAVKAYDDDEKISRLWKKIEEEFCSRMWVGGLQGHLNSGIVKFMLTNHFGAREVQKVEVSGQQDHTIFMRGIIKKSQEVE